MCGSDGNVVKSKRNEIGGKTVSSYTEMEKEIPGACFTLSVGCGVKSFVKKIALNSNLIHSALCALRWKKSFCHV